MEREYIERNAVLEEALSDKAVRGGLADETDIKRIIADVISADVVSVREYQELAGENRELKKLLKLAIEDFDTLFEETSECSFNLGCKYCPFGEIDTDGIPNCNEWRYKEEAEKLLEGDNKWKKFT